MQEASGHVFGMAAGGSGAGRRGLEKNEFEAGPWRIVVAKSHILRSKCEFGLEAGCPNDEQSRKKCNVCR